MTLEYQHEGNRLTWRRRITTLAEGAEYTIGLSARDVRREKTGIHARLDIAVNGVTLAYSTFNIERDEDRVRITNSAHKQYRANGLAADYPSEFLKKDVDLFCDGLWDEHVQAAMPSLTYGSMERRPPSFRLKPYVLEGGGTIIFGPPGRGKSYVLMLMAVAIDAGNETLWPVHKTKVLFINLERARRGVEDRLANINAVLGMERRRPLLMLHARGQALDDVAESIERTIRDEQVGCVLLDSISRAGMGDLIKNETANHIVDLLNGFGPDWIALAHTPRADESHIYGAMHFEAGADIMTALLSQQREMGPLGIGLKITKKNDIPEFPLQITALEFDEAGLTGVRGARKGEFPQVEAGREADVAGKLREYILGVPDATATATQAADTLGLNRSMVSRILGGEGFILVKRTRAGAFYGVVGSP